MSQITYDILAIKTKKLVRINMVKCMNASQVCNILYLETKTLHRGGYYLDKHPSQIWNFFYEILFWVINKNMFLDKWPLMENTISLATLFLELKWRYLSPSLYIVIGVLDKWGSYTNTIKVPFLLKEPKCAC